MRKKNHLRCFLQLLCYTRSTSDVLYLMQFSFFFNLAWHARRFILLPPALKASTKIHWVLVAGFIVAFFFKKKSSFHSRYNFYLWVTFISYRGGVILQAFSSVKFFFFFFFEILESQTVLTHLRELFLYRYFLETFGNSIKWYCRWIIPRVTIR